MEIFWEQQLKHLGTSEKGYGWHPRIIRLLYIALHFKSPAGYECLRDSCGLTLPSQRTLRHYTNYTKPSSCLSAETMQRITTNCHLDQLPKKSAVIAFDEIKIKEGLVYNSHTRELVGWTD